MAVNGRQISSDWRTVDYTGNYTSEKDGQTFVLRVGGAGNVVLRNIITDKTFIWQDKIELNEKGSIILTTKK